MSLPADNGAKSYLAAVRPLGTSSSHRCRPLHVLFIHRDPATVDSCLHALKKGQFIVTSDSVSSLALCAQHRGSPSHDVIIVEYPSPSIKGPQALQLFLQTVQQSALVFLSAGPGTQILAELAAHGPFEYLERQQIPQLPMVVRRALKEKKLRSELEEVDKALRHSQALYRALLDNPSYGVCHCDAQGIFLDVNQAFASMLGYDSRDELLAANRASHIVLGLGHSRSLAEVFHGSATFQPVEREWKRKDGTILKARLSGRDVLDEHGKFSGCEIILVDITEQRSLEDQLRHQAFSDSLTGLANHRRLFDVLHAEIARSQRTGREFSLLLLDLDGLKQINDQLGHLAGSRALCRLAQILKDSCRDTDTAARHGGDEFAVVLPETGVASAALVTRRICDLLDADSEEPRLSVSVGIASYPREADSIGGLLYAADRALYSMKSQKLASSAPLPTSLLTATPIPSLSRVPPIAAKSGEGN